MPPSTIRKQASKDVMLRREVVAERRRASIESREAARLAGLAYHKQQEEQRKQAGTKYPKSDVMNLKAVFDSYDSDGSGFIEKSELVRKLKKEKERAQHFDGTKKTLAERQAGMGRVSGQATGSRGVFLADFSDALFKALDQNKDGRIEFTELLSLMYPLASQAELSTMLNWLVDEPTPVTIEEFRLTNEQRKEIRSMFVLYDKDRSGTIDPAEFRVAMRRCGLDAEETDQIFTEADVDESGRIDFEEFTELMRQTLFSGDMITTSMLYSD